MEKKLLKSRAETQEKKIDSLVKFLENERRLRHELEDLVKHNEQREREISSKIGAIKEQADELN